MLKAIVLGSLLTASVFAADRTANLFHNLEGVVGNYRQATVILQDGPKGEPKDMSMRNPNATLSVKKISNDRFIVQTYETSQNGNLASTTVISRDKDGIKVDYFDFAAPYNSFKVKSAEVTDSAGTELAFYQSDVTYLDDSAVAQLARTLQNKLRENSYLELIEALSLAGVSVPKEIASADDYLNLMVFMRGAANPVSMSEILLDPLGKSVRTPKGAYSLTLLRVYAP
ncbi:hypothetical protein K2X33_05380 [bacterium]|nr:hypothetical protein [bacterium]